MRPAFGTGLLAALLALSGCQHGTQPRPAVLVDASDPNISALKGHLATAMGRAQIELGAGDPTTASRIAVLPPPLTDLETSSPVTPTMFELVMKGEACFAMREDSADMIALPGVRCRAA